MGIDSANIRQIPMENGYLRTYVCYREDKENMTVIRRERGKGVRKQPEATVGNPKGQSSLSEPMTTLGSW
jgi:hypothetical protein